MSMVLIIGIYLLGGVIINYGSIFLMYTISDMITKDTKKTIWLMRKSGRENGWDFLPGISGFPRFILTQILWPLNFYNTLRCGIQAIKEAREEDNDE